MPSMDNLDIDPPRDRLVVIGEGLRRESVVDVLRERYGDWTVTACDSYLAGIAEVGRRRPRVVLAGVDPALPRLSDAIAGLREAAGPDTKLVLLCPPHAEPVARRMLDSGVDDYLMLPLDGKELDKALGIVADDPPPVVGDPSASLADIARITDLIAGLDGEGSAILDQAAMFVQAALPTRGVRISLQGSAGTSGDPVDKPILMAPLKNGDAVLGQVTLGAPIDRAYAPQDVQKLGHFASLLGTLLAVRSRHHHWRKLAHTDDLSGLPNRRYFLQRVDQILEQAAREHLPVTLLIFDVDDFKTFNDVCGHDAGDEIIRLIARLVREQCREQDVASRIGGDEFAVVFWDAAGPRVPGSKHPDSALKVLERFQRALRAQAFPNLAACRKAHLTVSGGLATFPWDGSTRDELLKRADSALLAAKRAGKDRIFLIGEETDDFRTP